MPDKIKEELKRARLILCGALMEMPMFHADSLAVNEIIGELEELIMRKG